MIENIELYTERKQCYGCGACAQACEKKAITMQEDEEGFLYPVINNELCVQCGRCVQKCQIHQEMGKKSVNVKKPFVLAVRNRNEVIRETSSSGGVFYSLAKYILSQNGVVFGAAFNSDFEVEHIGIYRERAIEKLMGSKYVQSNLNVTYKEVKEHLSKGKWVLYVGTPCQISGLHSFLDGYNTDSLVCVSLICHGVCSPMVWRRYVKLKKGQYASEKITKLSFRDKKSGWHNFGIRISFEDVEYNQSFSEDLYMKGFLQNLYLRPTCYECKAKQEQVGADLIIGDFWGIENCCPEMDDDKGVSCVLLNSAKGEKLWEKVQSEFISKRVSYDQMEKSNSSLEKSVPVHPNREKFFEELKETEIIEESIRNNLKAGVIDIERRQLFQYPIVYKYLDNMTRGVTVADFVAKIGWKKIALYAVTDLMQIAYQDITKSEKSISIMCICDKGYKRYRNPFNGTPIVGIDYLKECFFNKEIDGVILCNPLRENAIYEELLAETIPLERIVSITSAIFN